ncbi:MAG: tetratricopeptide repeat protein [Telluria sp.]
MSKTDQIFQDAFRAHRAGELDVARKLYQRVLRHTPADMETLYLLGTALSESGEYEQAETYLRRAVRLDPRHPEALNNLGLTLKALRKTEEAVTLYRQALELRPDYADALNNLGNALELLGKLEEAEAPLRRALQLAPNHCDAQCNLGVVLYRRDRFEEAAKHLTRGLELRPDHAISYDYLGSIYKTWGRFDLALACFDKAVALSPDNYSPHNNRGAVLETLGRFDEALAEYQRADELAPADGSSAWNQAYLFLRQGRLDRGWDAHEIRLGENGKVSIRFPFPQWDGSSLAGKTILIYAEQGLGDEIMFASCFEEVIAMAGHVVIECAPRLASLFQRSFPTATVIGEDRMQVGWLVSAPRIDVQVAAGSLPRFLRPTIDSFPYHAGYLSADPERVAYWRGRVAALGTGLKVGICWRSGLMTGERGKYYSELTRWGDILKTEGVQFVNLQYGECSAELLEAEEKFGIPIKVFDEINLRDQIDDSAALMGALDLVISPATAVLQTAGAVGLDSFCINSFGMPWAMLGRKDISPWHPRTRQFNQETAGDWDTQLAMVAGALAEKVAGANETVGYLSLRSGVEVAVNKSIQDFSHYVLAEQGTWYDEEYEFMQSLVEPGMRVVDAGAGVGGYALPMAATAAGGRVYAVTESSADTNLLYKSRARNSLERQLDVALVHPGWTLDAFMDQHGLDDVSLVRLAGTFGSVASMQGGARFLGTNAPLVMFEIGSGPAFDAAGAKWLLEQRHLLFRLVPGLGVLVPFTSTDEIDQFTLNLFACKPERAAWLEQRGLLVGAPGALDALPGIEQRYWQDHLRGLPYAAPHLERWMARSAAQADWEVYWMALNLYALAKRSDQSAALRYACLEAAGNVLSSLVQEQPNLPRLLSLCRVTSELGKRELTVTLLNQVCELLDAGLPTALDEPFLVLADRFVDADFTKEPVRATVAMILEEREELRAFSTWFTGEEALPVLEEVQATGCATQDALRKIELIRARFGK